MSQNCHYMKVEQETGNQLSLPKCINTEKAKQKYFPPKIVWIVEIYKKKPFISKITARWLIIHWKLILAGQNYI